MIHESRIQYKTDVFTEVFYFTGRDKQFVATLTDEERMSWIWCIIIAFAVPEFGTLIRSIRICIFKSWKKPPASHFLLVFLMETFHVVGLALMFMAVLPDLDVVKGAMLTNCVCFVPGLLGKETYIVIRNIIEIQNIKFGKCSEFFMINP